MGPLYRIPRRFHPQYEEGRLSARRERLANPDHRTTVLAEAAQQRKERDHLVKIETTMQIARELTATRSARCPVAGSSPSPAAPHFDAVWAARWQRTKGKLQPPRWARPAEREAHSIELLAAAGRLPRRRFR